MGALFSPNIFSPIFSVIFSPDQWISNELILFKVLGMPAIYFVTENSKLVWHHALHKVVEVAMQ